MQLRLDKDSISGELFIPLPIYNKSHLKVSLLPCAPQCTHNVLAGWSGYIWEFNSTEQTSFDTVLCFFSGFLFCIWNPSSSFLFLISVSFSLMPILTTECPAAANNSVHYEKVFALSSVVKCISLHQKRLCGRPCSPFTRTPTSSLLVHSYDLKKWIKKNFENLLLFIKVI